MAALFVVKLKDVWFKEIIMAGCGGKKMAYGGKVKKMKEGGAMKPVDKKENPGLDKLPTEVRNKMGYMKKGGKVKPGYHKMPDGKIMKDSAHKKPKKMASGGMVKKGCDGKAVRGKTKGRMV